MAHHDRTITTERAPQQHGAFVAVRTSGGRLLGYYNPTTQEWMYEDKHTREVVSLKIYHLESTKQT